MSIFAKLAKDENAEDKMNRHAVIYARVSTEAQAEKGISLDMQVSRCLEYAEAHGLEVVDTVIDAGLSAKDVEHRPGLKRIIAMVQRKKIGRLICCKLDRLNRNTVQGLQLMELLSKKGVQLHVADEQSVVKSDTADDTFLLTLKMSLAQRERQVIGERTRAALARKREKNEFCGGEAPYGYRAIDGKLVIDATEQNIIRKIRKLRNKGYSIRRIVSCLQEDGHLNRREKPFQKTQVERILKAA